MHYLRTKNELLAAVMMSAVVLGGCSNGSSSSDNWTGSLNEPPEQPSIDPKVLDSAASFLGAATGKEIPLTIDNVVFVNSALGLNDVPRDPQNLFGDLWMIKRDEYGVPVLDAQGCIQPIASETITWPDGSTHNTVPMILETVDNPDLGLECSVVEGYEQYTVELEIGRLNMIRTSVQNPRVFAQALEEAIKNINAAEAVTTDPAGRLVLINTVNGEVVESTIDSPRENLALYNALLKEGRIAGYGPEKKEGGTTTPPQWLEISPDVPLGDLAYLRDGTPGRDHGVDLHNGYADLSQASHNRMMDYLPRSLTYIQYVDNSSGCFYEDRTDNAWLKVFNLEDYYGENIAGFTTHADDTRRTIVFTHDVIQDMPDAPLQTLPATVVQNNMDLMHAAAAFLGGASNKSVPLTVDGLVFLNTVLGLNQNVPFNNKGELYGDLWRLLRDADGAPILDSNGCPQPLSASNPGGVVPMEVDETGECVVVPGNEDDVIEVELGRLNVVRVALTNPRVLDRTLYDVINSINASVGLKLDLSGRLAYGVDDGTGNASYYQTVDSPLAGLAMYWALMKWGKLEGDVEIMQDGSWVTQHLAITLDDAVLDAEGLLFLKKGTSTCQGNGGMNCGVGTLPNGFVDYRSFTHTTQDIYGGVNVDFVERQPAGSACGYADQTADVWTRVLGSDGYTGTNIEAFVKQAEDTRNVIQFTHTVIQDPLP